MGRNLSSLAGGAMAALVTAVLLVQCKQVPTSVLLRVEGPGIAAPDRLVLSVYTSSGRVVDARTVPEEVQGPLELPSDLVLFPAASSGTLRIHVRARGGGTLLGEGTTAVTLQAEQQVQATVVLAAGALSDRDGDGVPDAIDSCPDLANPAQGPCAADGGPDLAPADARPETAPDGAGDGLLLDAPPVDLPLALDLPLAPDLPPVPDLVPPCTCPLGCVGSTTSCRKLVTSSGYKAAKYDSLSGITGTGATIDTTLCVLQSGSKKISGTKAYDSASKVKACVIGLKSLTIGKSGVLTATGSLPLVLLVQNNVKIQGLLDVGAHGSTPGPGGAAGGKGTSAHGGGGPGGGFVCGCGTGSGPTTDDCGGGGGGHATAGGKGGAEGTACTLVSAGGKTYGSTKLVPLTAGSGGASGDANNGGAGGAGGGALQISSGGTITIDGAITAGGGGGSPGPYSSSTGKGLAGGGGGSGGGVLLEAGQIGGKGLVAVNGGGGAGAGGLKDAVKPCTGWGSKGQDGGASKVAALGGTAAGSNCGKGGNGSFQTSPPTAGGAGVANTAGGGGGGGAGRIRLNWYKHTSKAPIATSGSATMGEVQAK